MAFRRWPAEAIEFFDGLEVDDSKGFWEAHRATDERCVRAPMEDLLQERRWPSATWPATRRSKDRAVASLRAAAPPNDRLTAHVGPTASGTG